MWHLVHGNRASNGQIRWLETHKILLPEVALLKIPMDGVQYNREHWHGWWAQRLGVAETACRNPLYWFKDMFELNEYMHIDYCPRDSVAAQYL